MGREEFLFLLAGLKWTVALSVVAFICGSIAGLMVALARTSGIFIVERLTAGISAAGLDRVP